MAEPARLLILGGTAEAVALARRAAADPRYTVTYSLAWATRDPALPDCAVRAGGFGGADGLADYLRDSRTGLLIDATHPFAARMSRNAAAACADAGVPRLTLRRPPWRRRKGDAWTEVPDADAAAAHCAGRVFLTVGARDIAPFAARPDVWFLVRRIEPPEAPLPLANYALVTGRGPFDAADEARLMREHRIDCVVSRNSGGTATYGKIAAARALGLPVVMIRRPAGIPGAAVGTVDAAMDWIGEFAR